MNLTRAAWYEGPEERIQVKGGGGGPSHKADEKVREHDHKIADHALRQDLYVPCCYSRGKEAGMNTDGRQVVVHSRKVPTRLDISVVDMRGSSSSQSVDLRRSGKVQNIDVGPQSRGCWEYIVGLCMGFRNQNKAALTPPKLERHFSYYPGRSDTQKDPFK